jgi:hypothetical protein
VEGTQFYGPDKEEQMGDRKGRKRLFRRRVMEGIERREGGRVVG